MTLGAFAFIASSNVEKQMQSVISGIYLEGSWHTLSKIRQGKKGKAAFPQQCFSRRSLETKHKLKEYSLNGEKPTFPVCSLFYPLSIIVIIKINSRSVL